MLRGRIALGGSVSEEMTAREYMDSGYDWKSRIARLTLPILIWVAKHGKTITYKQLATELQFRYGEEIKRRMTLYGWPVGKIGHALIYLSDEWGEEVPPINALVVNAQSGLPGKGANNFIVKFLNRKVRRRLTDSNRNALAEEAIQSVWDYPDWDRVAKEFGISKRQLTPVKELLSVKQDDDPIVMPPVKPVRGSQGESDQHISLKRWAAQNPKHFARFGKFPKGQNEYLLRSGDSLDAYLENGDSCLAIEVKASNVPASEIFKGIFQCVKYRATLRAMQLAAGEVTNAQAVLLTTAKIPKEAVRLAKRVRVEILTAPITAEKS